MSAAGFFSAALLQYLNMRKLLFISICCLFVGSLAMAQETEGKKEKMVKGFLHTILYLKDGTTAEGYLQNSTPGFLYIRYRIPDACDSVMILRPDNKLFTKSRKFYNCDIDSMITWFDGHPKEIMKWEPQFVDFTFGSKVSGPSSYSSMLFLLYQGKYVKGYVSCHPFYGFKYLFKTDDMPYAKAFLKPNQKLSEKRKKTLLDTFYMYPDMEVYIKGLTKEDIKDDPFCILKKLDDILSASSSQN